ncbi:MAG TPA: hypothetical protein VIV60_27145, partial [Polyangiaceae bacterium]
QVRPDLPEALARAIDAAMVKVPSKRLASVEQFEELLMPHAMPLDEMAITQADLDLTPVAILRPPRTRRNNELRLQILASLDHQSASDDVTVRHFRPISEDQVSRTAERLSVVPSLGQISTHPRIEPLIRVVQRQSSTNDENRRSTRATRKTFAVTTTVVALLVMGLLAVFSRSFRAPSTSASSEQVSSQATGFTRPPPSTTALAMSTLLSTPLAIAQAPKVVTEKTKPFVKGTRRTPIGTNPMPSDKNPPTNLVPKHL